MSPGRWSVGAALGVLAGVLLWSHLEPAPLVRASREDVQLPAQAQPVARTPSLSSRTPPASSTPPTVGSSRSGPTTASRLVRPYLDPTQISDGRHSPPPSPIAGLSPEEATRYRAMLQGAGDLEARKAFHAEKRRLKHAYKRRRSQGLVDPQEEKPWKALERASRQGAASGGERP